MDAINDPYVDHAVAAMMNVSDVQLGETIRERLKIQRDTGRFCDVVFHVHSIEFLAHRCILAACSPYFDSVLDLNRYGKEHLTISADWKIFSELIDFIYTGKIYIHEGNVAELLRLSGYFLMSGLKDYCGEFLERSMSVKNCLGIKALSEKCGLLNLAINSTGFIQEHINEITGELELFELSKAKLEAFLNNKAFNISNELKLVMISRWVLHKLSDREEEFKKLISLVQLPQVDHLRVIELIQIENLYHASEHCLYHILHELYSFGVQLGLLEVTYSDLCRKVVEQPRIEGNVLDLAVNAALGDMTPAMQEYTTRDLRMKKDMAPGTEGLGDHSLSRGDSTCLLQASPTIKDQSGFIEVVMPAQGEGSNVEPKIVDHLSYTKVEDMEIVKEHVFEETNAVGQVHFKPRFQGNREENPNSATTSKSLGAVKTESLAMPGKDIQVPVVAKREALDEDKILEAQAAAAAEAVPSASELYEGETDEDFADADYVADDNNDNNEESKGIEEAKPKVKAEPKDTLPEQNRRKRKGRPRKTEKVKERMEGDTTGSEGDEDEEWKVETTKSRPFSKARKRTVRARHSTTSTQADKKKKLVMKLSVKRKKGAKKPVPPKKTRIKVKADTFKCEECNFTARSLHRVEVHSLAAHKQNVVQACGKCDFKTNWNKEYFQHMRGHFTGPPFSCDEEGCKYVSDKFQLLLHHRRRHSDDRPFECETCQMKFRTKNNLTSHVRCHSGEKPFECPDCQRCFATKSTLNQHSVTHSNHRPYLCDTCGFSTKYQSHLIAHKRIHTGDVYRCVHAGCTYFTPKRSQLNAHMRIHMSIRSHICSQCGRGFVERSHLVRHEKLHSNEKGFKCSDCDYASYRRDKLKLHVEKHHSPGSNSNTYKPRKQRTQKVPGPQSVFHHNIMPGNYGFQGGPYPGMPSGQQVDTKPIVDEQMYASSQLEPMNVREQFPMYHRAPTPPPGNQGSPTGLSPNSSGAPTTLTNVRQPRVAGYIVQPMSEQNQGVYTPQGDIGGLGAFMALF
ncbi:uncharacterized protein LOC135491669 [Lineus longissimus]|uniref:uncharacterized protein LOC135491669 n=1 Tax=Lineus longissimus TaxID=88925 RepID=UPI002B4CDFEF